MKLVPDIEISDDPEDEMLLVLIEQTKDEPSLSHEEADAFLRWLRSLKA